MEPITPKHITDAQHQQLAGTLATELAEVIPSRFFDGAFTFEGMTMAAPRGTPRALVILAMQLLKSQAELAGFRWDDQMMARAVYSWAKAYLEYEATIPKAPEA